MVIILVVSQHFIKTEYCHMIQHPYVPQIAKAEDIRHRDVMIVSKRILQALSALETTSLSVQSHFVSILVTTTKVEVAQS